MAELATIARPYARAAFKHALASNALKAWGDVLGTASKVVSDPRVAQALSAPTHGRPGAAELVAGIVSAAGTTLDQGARNFLMLLGENHRLDALPQIAVQFEALRAEAENTIDVEVVTAMALTDGQKAQLKAALGSRFKREVRLHESVDPTLIGGAVIHAGDLVIDGSLKGRLARLATQMTRD